MMTIDNSLWVYFADAGAVVKFVMLILFAASIISWTLIIQRGMLIKKAKQNVKKFEEQFWSGIELNTLYKKTLEAQDEANGLQTIFKSGFKEFLKASQKSAAQNSMVDLAIERAGRSMRVAQSRLVDKLEQHLAILATIGSTSPYVGLFGTVWGIMTAFHSLGAVQQASISMVAPGISEALIATAMGLFAAIPAVVAYNRYANEVERLENQYATFSEEFSAILYRETHEGR